MKESFGRFSRFWAELPRFWQFFVPLAFFAGAILRLIYLDDMEFKEDEHYDFIQTQLIGRSSPWPWEGMPSGVYIPNPGMSVWVFVWLARLTGAHDPVALMRSLAVFAIVGMALILPFCAFFLPSSSSVRGSRTPFAKPETATYEPWLWALALSLVNPLEVYIQRKLWPEPFLPFFAMIFLMAFFRRERAGGAFIWGFVGALLGQVHMSGFFFALAFFLWALFFEKKFDRARPRFRFGGWFWGSCAGALPLVPWAYGIFKRGVAFPPGGGVSSGFHEAIQLKFWVFWISDAFGFHLGNPLGLLRGTSHWAQLSDFVRYPLIAGRATYLNGIAHLGILVVALGFLTVCVRGAILRAQQRTATAAAPAAAVTSDDSQTRLSLSAAFFGFGALMTATGVVIRRYYMRVSYPLEHLWLTRLFLRNSNNARAWLIALWLFQLFISACFVGYVHVNNGATQGDYGDAFHVIRDRNLRTTGKPWPDHPNDYGY